jgi:conjugal transfer pilus assembly protein TraB
MAEKQTSSAKQLWAKLNPKQRQMAVIGGAVALLMVVAMFTTSPKTTAPKELGISSTSILTDSDPRRMTVDALGARVREIEQMMKEQQRLIRQADEQIKVFGQRENIVTKSDIEFAKQEIQREVVNAVKKELTQFRQQGPARRIDTPTDPTNPFATPVAPPPILPDAMQPSGTARTPPQPGQGAPQTAGAPPPVPSGPRIRVIESPPAQQGAASGGAGTQSVALRDPADDEFPSYLPVGTIITGRLLNGVDAPTGKKAQDQPYPVLLRVTEESIGANYLSLDIRECFVQAASWGELSTERVYMRADKLACVRSDNKVIETSLNAYGNGEDGKVGLRGRLVNKQGQLIARALIAGAMEGFAQVFRQNPVATIASQASDRQAYQQVLSSDSLTAGASSGAASAMDRLAQYYIDMADQIFPVIEVDADREVTFIVNVKGTRMVADAEPAVAVDRPTSKPR